MWLKGCFSIFFLCLILSCGTKNDTLLKDLVISQLKNTHTNQEWFATTNIALKDLSYQQAIWKDSIADHSIAELVSHITFWNEINLKSFKGLEIDGSNINNDATFQTPSEKEWSNLVKKLDSLQTEWELSVENASVEQIQEWNNEITNMCSHTAYHTGQIVYIRKQNNWWK